MGLRHDIERLRATVGCDTDTTCPNCGRPWTPPSDAPMVQRMTVAEVLRTPPPDPDDPPCGLCMGVTEVIVESAEDMAALAAWEPGQLALGRQMERSPALNQEELDVVRFTQRNSDVRQNLLRGLEVELFGVDENAVVVPENRLRRIAVRFRVPRSRFQVLVHDPAFNVLRYRRSSRRCSEMYFNRRARPANEIGHRLFVKPGRRNGNTADRESSGSPRSRRAADDRRVGRFPRVGEAPEALSLMPRRLFGISRLSLNPNA